MTTTTPYTTMPDRSSVAASPPASMLAAFAPWMPLEPLMELWATYGRSAQSVSALKATSTAFAALAEEREALQSAMRLAERVNATPARYQQVYQPPDQYPSHAVCQQEIVEALTHAAQHWYEAALLLAEVDDALSAPACDDLDYSTFIGYTFQQRARVWAIAQTLLEEQVWPYRALLEHTDQGTCGEGDMLEGEPAPASPAAQQQEEEGMTR